MVQKAVGIKTVALFAVLALFFTLMFEGGTSQAQTPATTTTSAPPVAGASAALSVSPPTSSINATPGETSTQKIGLDNISDETRTVNVLVQNFSAAPNTEDGQAALSEGEGTYSLSQWIKADPPSATLPPHGHQDFQITINVPLNAPPGGHFGAIVFSPNAGQASGGAALSVVSQVTSLILLRVPGDIKEDLSFESVNICLPPLPKNDPNTPADQRKRLTTCDKSKSVIDHGPITFTARFRNKGNVQVAPRGTVTVTNTFGSKVFTGTIPVPVQNQTSAPQVLPDSIRRFDVTWNNKHGFGRYTAKYALHYGDAGKPLTYSKTFWVIPLQTVAVIVGTLILVFLIFWLPRKRLKKAFKAFATASD